MKLFRIRNNHNETIWYEASRPLAKRYLKALTPDQREQLFVEQLNIPTKAGDVVAYLNGVEPSADFVVAKWDVTRRGGLVEFVE